ncbi:MAG TPA: signal recognition particle protein [Spirochaetia bacterium]|nr:MAG: signal recognition particle protein [Spirochaetes bacterium GWB1_36_13]HCL55731.1 signal recognition particle protein [Spirochaetia bacterium]
MLERLEEKFDGIFRKLKGLSKISSKNIEDGIREIRLALLEADVNYKVVKDIISDITDKALGQEVFKKVSPLEQFYKIVYDELIAYLGTETPELNLKSGETTVIMMVGLQGSGKTTTASKLAYFLKDKANVLLVGADVYRPAAKDQLRVLAEKEKFAFYTEDHQDAVLIAQNALKYAKKNIHNVLILDTAGRLHIDDEMMNELSRLKKEINPHEILFVADSMAGQNIVDVAASFNEKLNLTGIILSKFDSDSKGGAALSIKKAIGKPVKFIGVGEKIKDLEIFYPDRIASRIMGRGDILSLVEKTQKVIEEDEAEQLAKKMMSGNIDLNDFLTQLKMMRKIGSFSSIMQMMPLPGNMKNVDASKAEAEIKKMEAIIFSMTKKERGLYKIIESSRKRRIAKGSGTTIRDVTMFIEHFQKMGKMMKKLSKNMKMVEKLMGSQKIDMNMLGKGF